MKTLDKQAIQEIAKEFKVKASVLAAFVTRMPNNKDKAEAELQTYRRQMGITKQDYLAAKSAIEAMFPANEPTAKKKKKKVSTEAAATEGKGAKEGKEGKEKKSKEKAEASGEKEVYNYPADVEDKKEYRRKKRAEKNKMLKTIEDAKTPEEKTKAEKAYAKFRKETYAN